MTFYRRFILALVSLGLFACSEPMNPANEVALPDMHQVAKDYLFLELAMGEIDESHVDAYFGPEEIRASAKASKLTLNDIRQRASDLNIELQNMAKNSDVDRARVDGLQARLRALKARISINQGALLKFDDESAALFGTVAPTYDAAHFDSVLAEIDILLPGPGTLSSRVETFKSQFAISLDKLPQVFAAAMAECRRRTLEHIDLVGGESFTIEYVTDKPWSGYNWYQGNSVSVIQINTDFPITIDRAVDLGCHEGYPGHHTFNALLEKNLVVDRGWLEYSLYPLFSPESVIAEGSGNYGIELAFPGKERISYEIDVLFPLAELEQSEAEHYYALLSLLEKLDYAGNEAARGYLNGDLSREQAVEWLMKYSLTSQSKSEQRTRFFDTYRSYVINYNHGKDLVADYIEKDNADIDTRWQRFETMLSEPILPAELEK